MRQTALGTMIVVLFAVPAAAQDIGPAPSGEEAVVAQQVIRDNFDEVDCPLVVAAQRFGDGSIKAQCNNGETFRVFSVSDQIVAMKCSAALRLGVSGC